MNVFEHLINNIRKIQPEEVVQPAIDKETLDFIAELNKEQLEQSKNAQGKDLGEYHQNTVTFYNEYRTTKVGLGESVKLYDTGQLYDSISAEVEKDKIKLEADYDSTILDKLEETYGKFIGLTKENMGYVSKMITPNVISEIKRKLIANL